ncbi:22223_t:CDS:2 [Cetraspora pellucida]|uniref:22223_t:CDS:1 n=1 Tax=Cetraspora pellucida TaxID=1433469 RepID=A0A9N8VJ71_9GLOM|nr:22223_t:CDS:2 [Cetraspora pellucida]
MLTNIEKYVVQRQMDSETIYSLLKYDYSKHSLYKYIIKVERRKHIMDC